MRHALLALAVAGALAVLLAAAPAVAQDDFTAEFEEDRVAAGANATLHVAGASDETVSVTSPELSNEQVAAVLGGMATTDGGVIVELPDDGDVAADFDGFACRAGTYTFRVHGDDGTVNATIDVVSTAQAKTAFTDSVIHVAPNGTAAVRVHTECPGGAARVTLAGDGYAAGATLSFDDPGTATLLVDTGAAGDVDPLTTFAAENATLADATVRRDEVDPPLSTGEYDLNVSVNGAETDVAVLRVTTDTPTPTPTATRSPTASPTDTPTVTVARTVTLTDSPTPTRTPTAGPEPTTRDDETTTGSPGFGLAAALVALAALLARRG